MPTSTISDFQDMIWRGLPDKKRTAGREVVFDTVLVCVQEWPAELLVHPPEVRSACLIETLISTKRILEFVYGQKQFARIWRTSLANLLPQIVELIFTWWKSNKSNRGKLLIWRRRWTVGRD
jgi:hypothetical protein